MHFIALQIECSKVFLFKTVESKERYVEQYMAFRERNRKQDEFMEHDEVRGSHRC